MLIWEVSFYSYSIIGSLQLVHQEYNIVAAGMNRSTEEVKYYLKKQNKNKDICTKDKMLFINK